MRKILNISYWQQFRVYIPGILNGLVVAIVVYLVSLMLRSLALPLLAVLVSQMITGALVFLAMVLLFPHPALKEQLRQIMSRFGGQDNSTTFYGRMISKYKKTLVNEAESVSS